MSDTGKPDLAIKENRLNAKRRPIGLCPVSRSKRLSTALKAKRLESYSLHTEG